MLKNIKSGKGLALRIDKALTELPKEVLKPLPDNWLEIPQTEDSSNFYLKKPQLVETIMNIIDGKQSLITGPTGSGKSELFYHVARLLEMPCEIFDMSAMQDPISGMIGTRTMTNGTTGFNLARFAQSIQKPGLCVLDEVNRSPLEANNITFSLTDFRKCIEVPFNDVPNLPTRIKKHPECIIVATANIGAQYSGTNKIDAAFSNRFIVTQMDYLDHRVEAGLLAVRFQLNINEALCITEIARTTRELYAGNTLPLALSTRHTQDMARYRYNGFSLGDAVCKIAEPLYTSDKKIAGASDYLTQFNAILDTYLIK
jgi:MoxR-like ATPase